jgi:hypothetical protein
VIKTDDIRILFLNRQRIDRIFQMMAGPVGLSAGIRRGSVILFILVGLSPPGAGLWLLM